MNVPWGSTGGQVITLTLILVLIPQMNAPMQRTPSGPTQLTARVVADTISTGVRQILNSGSKAIQ